MSLPSNDVWIYVRELCSAGLIDKAGTTSRLKFKAIVLHASFEDSEVGRLADDTDAQAQRDEHGTPKEGRTAQV